MGVISVMCANDCGREVPPREGLGPPRSYCLTCRPLRERDRGTAAVSPIRKPTTAQPVLVDVTRDWLARAGVDATPEGIVVLILAEQLQAGGGTQAGLATLAKAFREQLAATLDQSTAAGDVIDGIFGT